MINQFTDDVADKLSETIAAIATPPGQSGIAVIRISGPASDYIGDTMFEPAGKNPKKYSQMSGYTCAAGYWLSYQKPEDGFSKSRKIDQVVVTKFSAPRSYTGEDILEISCHGGTAIKEEILSNILSSGVKAAGPGEFTKRAFLNGKLDLAQAEAVMDIISSEARLQAKAALNQLQGQVSEQIKKSKDRIYELLARTELILEFPEHEETPENINDLKKQIVLVKQTIQHLTDSYSQGRLLSEGMTVVIAGKPNAGKSSMMNQLAGFERTIVTDIPGTTRDTIRETIDLDGLPVHLIDTAGIRESADPVEKLGINRAKQAMEKADLLIWLVSPPISSLANEITDISNALKNDVPLMIVCGKEDLNENQEIKARLVSEFPSQQIISFSAITGEGLKEIRALIHKIYNDHGQSSNESVLITNIRHKEAAANAVKMLSEAETALNNNLTLDLIAMLLRSSAEALSEITGDCVSEEIVQAIFSRFCVGK